MFYAQPIGSLLCYLSLTRSPFVLEFVHFTETTAVSIPSDSLTFQELQSKKPDSFNIANTDCSFKKQVNGCPVKYKARGTCNFDAVTSQLFPDVNLEESTNRFIVPAKFEVNGLDIFDCQGNQQNGMVSFLAYSVESVELVTQQLTLGVETGMKISWNTLTAFDPEKLEVRMKGSTSIGMLTLATCFSLQYILSSCLLA